jgi:hypothetical protein
VGEQDSTDDLIGNGDLVAVGCRLGLELGETGSDWDTLDHTIAIQLMKGIK